MKTKTNFAVSTSEYKYEKAYNEFYKLFSIEDNYNLKLHNKNFNSVRYLMPVKMIDGRIICYRITSKWKSKKISSHFPKMGKDNVDIWVMFEPIIIPHTSLIAKEKIQINYEMIKKHFLNLQKYSSDEKPYFEYFVKTYEYLKKISDDDSKKIKKEIKQELSFLKELT